ncbi:MAG: hypothetical protein ACJ8GN_11140 [Longimicrobiaceae bacterium]
MRTRLLLALLAVPVLGAALPSDAAAQRHRDRVVRVHRDRGYRERIYIPSHRERIYVSSHRYKDRDARYRIEERRYRDAYRDRYRIRDQYRYRDRGRYRYEYRRHRTSLSDLVLIAAGEALSRGHRHSRHCGHGRYTDLY